MPYEQWEAFAKFAHFSINRYYSSPGVSFETYCEKLTILVSEVIGEKRRTLLDRENSIDDKIGYIESMISKINFLFSNLFEECAEGLRYLPDKVIITDDNNNEISSAKQLKQNIINLGNEFSNEHRKILNQQFFSVQSSKKRRQRMASRASFEIKKVKEVNLRAVHNILTNKKHPFINANTSYEVFKVPFSGAPVTEKVNWLEVSALHYFINEIHGKGTERANEGHWIRASRCFTANGKEYTSRQLNDACDPTATVTSILDTAIRYFL
jgi:hypothetical protein